MFAYISSMCAYVSMCLCGKKTLRIWRYTSHIRCAYYCYGGSLRVDKSALVISMTKVIPCTDKD